MGSAMMLLALGEHSVYHVHAVRAEEKDMPLFCGTRMRDRQTVVPTTEFALATPSFTRTGARDLLNSIPFPPAPQNRPT